jgi:hypothetical protein
MEKEVYDRHLPTQCTKQCPHHSWRSAEAEKGEAGGKKAAYISAALLVVAYVGDEVD